MAEALVFATTSGAFARWPMGSQPPRVPIDLARDERPVAPLQADEDDVVLALTSDGMAYPVAVAELPVARFVIRGARPLPVARGQALAALAPLSAAGGYLLLVTVGGEVKRLEAAVLARTPAEGAPAYDVPEGDRLLAAVPHAAEQSVILQSRAGRALRLAMDAIRPVKTPSAGGVSGLAPARGDQLVGATAAADDDLLVVLHRRGAGKVVPVTGYPIQGRGGIGVASSAVDVPKRTPAGPVHAVCAAPPAATVLVVTSLGAVLAIAPGRQERASRATVARPLARTDVGHEVIGAVAVP